MLTDYILIQLNGNPFNCVFGTSLRDIVLYLDLNVDSIVIEYNLEIIANIDLDKTIVMSGDKIEIVTIVGGG
uniref:Thiamine biosynthesis protein S n=1 Tax=Calliarthron tuberculosum TaxID=48942 RepID=M4IU36_CALTB|nr:thiamine biosynthesis protein S [Calliarthron tuberculosum]AGA63788.1 thiamine biosynthesis protein S [Calliarthron tuberculosum]